MRRLQTILHPTDFSECAHAALGYALQLARRHHATLHLLNAGPSLGDDPLRTVYDFGSGDERLYVKMAEEAQRHLDALLEQIEADDVEIVTAHERGLAPGPVIVDYAATHEADLIVMGTHGRRGLRRFLLGSVAEEVVQRAPCSVLTVRGEATPGAEVPPMQRILVPVDLSDFSEPLLRAAKAVATSFGAHIHLLHVVEPLPLPAPLVGAITLHDLVDNPVERAEQQLQTLIRTVDEDATEGDDASITPHVAEGQAAQVITRKADAEAVDMIMMASHGLTGLGRLLIGSVTAQVLRTAHCPVWVARLEP